MNPVKVVVTDRIRLKRKYIPKKDIDKRYLITLFDESACASCKNRPERHPENELCEKCPSFQGVHRFYNSAEAKEGVWSLPQADLLGVKTYLSSRDIPFKVIDKRPKHKFSAKIKFTGTLFKKGDIDADGFKRADQVGAVKKWLKYKSGIIHARTRTGKCLTGDTLINTDLGFVHMDEIIKEEGYFEYNGKIASRNGIRKISHTYKSKSKTRKIHTEHGVCIEGTPEHPVLVFRPDLSFEWVPLNKVKTGDYLVTSSPKTETIWPTSDVISIEEAKLLGYWVANGATHKISTSDPHIQKEINKCCLTIFGEPCRIVYDRDTPDLYMPKGFMDIFLRQHGLYQTGKRTTSKDKFVPLAVRMSSKRVMIAFLSAYFLCDSTRNGDKIELSSASEKLMRQIHTILWQGFGIQGKLQHKSKKASNSNTPTERDYYFIYLPTDSIPSFAAFFEAKALSSEDLISFGGNQQGYRYKAIPYMMQYYKKLISENTIGYDNHAPVVCGENGSHFIPTKWFHRLCELTSQLQLSRLTNQIMSEIRQLSYDSYKKFKILKKGYTFSRVVSNVSVAKKKFVYDLTVPKGHNYYANGVLCHNTVLSTYLTCKLGVRSVIIANQTELLRQFHETFTGKAPPRFLRGKFQENSESSGRKGMTNINRLEEKLGRKIIFLPENFKQLEDYIARFGPPDILLITYQSFIRDLDRVEKIINRYYSFATIDEAHGTGAEQYLAFIARLKLRYRLGLTATPDRKDSRSKLTARILGPVVVSIRGSALQPKISFVSVKAKPPYAHKSWVGAESWMKKSKDRNMEIVQETFSDLRRGHNVIIIPVNHRDHQEVLIKMINQQARINYEKRGENWPEELAKPFHRSVKRTATLNWVDSYDKKGKISKRIVTRSPRVLVGIRSMIQQGIDLKRPSMIYTVIPMSGKYGVGAPAFMQMSNRPCTPYKDKIAPECKIFVDNIPMFAKAISSLLYNEILPKSNLKLKKEYDYILSPDDYKKGSVIIKTRSGNPSKNIRWWE